LAAAATKSGRKTRRKSTSRPSDPATQYALDVGKGRIVAGPHVRAACERHLRDLKKPPKDTKGGAYKWEPENVARVLGFFRETLKLDGGAEEPKAFAPEPWQAFVLGSLFGWVNEDGHRRFRVAFVETGKGSGKSPMAAGIGLYMLMVDGERRAEVYAAAVDKEQAGISFRDAVSMSKLSPAIDSRVMRSGGDGREYNIAYLDTGSFFRPISSESQGRGKSGYRPHCVLLDEIHEHPTNAMVEFMRAGTKGRRQALIFMITNSGVDRTSVCFEYHKYGSEVAAGERKDESFFSYICALDEGDEPFEDRTCWPKVSPSLGVTFPESYLEEQVAGAKGMPSKESIVRRLNFCQWVDAENPWIDGDLWRSCEVAAEEWVDPVGVASFGLDLSAKRDLTAAARAVLEEDGTLAIEVRFYTPADTLQERELADRVPYGAWVRGGYLVAVPGRSVGYDFVVKDLADWLSEDGAGLAFDQWRMEDFVSAMDDAGVDSWLYEGPKAPEGVGLRMVRHAQGFGGGASDKALWMPRSITATEDAILTGKLRVKKNPVLTWCSASAVLESDAAENKKWSKRKSTGRIDGIVALSMAVGLAMADTESEEPQVLVFGDTPDEEPPMIEEPYW
jgi:phage terminase large subunit-like protein